jgi:hypothetical protein
MNPFEIEAALTLIKTLVYKLGGNVTLTFDDHLAVAECELNYEMNDTVELVLVNPKNKVSA